MKSALYPRLVERTTITPEITTKWPIML